MASSSIIFKYSVGDSAGLSGTQPFKEKAKVESIQDWVFIDKLNQIKNFKFFMPLDDFHKANALMERQVEVPFIDRYKGIVTGRSKQSKLIRLDTHDLSWHFTRRIFTIDGEKRITYTTDDWFNASWLYRKKIVIQKKRVIDQIKGYPFLFEVSADLGFAAHAQTNGDDFVFTAKDGTTQIPHELENYNSTTGALFAHVNVDKISDNSNATIYVYYGNSGASNQECITNTWKNLYKQTSGTVVTVFCHGMVHHLDATNGLDSTENNNDATDTCVTYSTDESGPIGNAGCYDAVNSKTDVGSGSTLDNIFACNGWVTSWTNITSDGEGSVGRILCKIGWDLQVNSECTGNVRVQFTQAHACTNGIWQTAVDIPITTDTRIDVVHNNSCVANNPTIYINGTARTVCCGLTETSTPVGAATSDAANNLIVGNNTGQTATFEGEIDEVRTIKVPPADVTDIIKTEYNNQNTPSTFFTLHPQEQYQKAANLILQEILDSASNDMPAGLPWTIGEIVDTTVLTLKAQFKNHWEAMQILARACNCDIWFDTTRFKVFLGTKGRTVDEELDLTISVTPEESLDNFANIICIVGSKQDDGLNIEKEVTATTNELRYNYEKITSDSQISTDTQITAVANGLLDEFKKLTPEIAGIVPATQFKRLDLQSGDVITLSKPAQDLTGQFRIMELEVTSSNVGIKLERNDTGTIRARSLSLTDVINGLLKKIEETNLD